MDSSFRPKRHYIPNVVSIMMSHLTHSQCSESPLDAPPHPLRDLQQRLLEHVNVLLAHVPPRIGQPDRALQLRPLPFQEVPRP